MIGLTRKFLLIVPVVLIVGFIFRPTVILGVDGESLAASVGVPVGQEGFGPCEEAEEQAAGEDEAWTCTLPNDPDSIQEGSTSYALTVDSWGCWKIEGSLGNGGQAPDPPKSEDCVTLISHIKAID